MRARFCRPALFAALAACAFADAAADRIAIGQTTAGLNEQPRPAALFTADSDAPAELARLLKAPADPPTVTISHEPFGEATINFPAVTPPRFSVRAIRFVTPDVALADGGGAYSDTQTVPVLFIMKREDGVWKIASLRRLAAVAPPAPVPR